MRSVIDATQPEQRHGLALNKYVNQDGVPADPYIQSNPTPSPCSAFRVASVADRCEMR